MYQCLAYQLVKKSRRTGMVGGHFGGSANSGKIAEIMSLLKRIDLELIQARTENNTEKKNR